jgi:hypothetical protein
LLPFQLLTIPGVFGSVAISLPTFGIANTNNPHHNTPYPLKFLTAVINVEVNLSTNSDEDNDNNEDK